MRAIRVCIVHGALTGLLCWSLWAQLTYRLPGRLVPFVLPWIVAGLTLYEIAAWVNFMLVERDPAAPRTFFKRMETITAGAVLLVAFYGLFLFANGKFDLSDPVMHVTEVVDVGEPENDLLPRLPYAWATLRSWRHAGGTERVFLRPEERRRTWGGQPVAVVTKRGYYNVTWVAAIEPDETRRTEGILKAAPMSRLIWQQRAEFFLRNREYDQARATTVEYVRRFPAEHEFPVRIAGLLTTVERPADVAAILTPVLKRHRRADVLALLGYAVSQVRRGPEGIALLREARALEPTNWWPVYALGWAYDYAGDYRSAINMFETALKMRPGLAQVEQELQRIRPLAAGQRPT
jgi:hypothetical protein